MSSRLVWVDWLKALVVLGVVVYHAAQPFVLTEWLVADDEKSLVLSALAGVGYLFAMPLMFLLAGTASMLAIRRRPWRDYLRVRLLRLGLPLLVGLVLLSPFEAWIGHLSRGGSASHPEFASNYLADALASLGTSPMWLGDVGHHLWFLGFLLAYVLVSLPVLVRLRDAASYRLVDGGSRLVLLAGPAIVLGAIQWPLRAAFPGYRDWADAVLWLAYFALGVALALDGRLVRLVAASGLRALAVAAVLVAALAPWAASGDLLRLEGEASLDLAGLAYAMGRTGIGWSLVLACLALGIRALDRWEPSARRAGEASLAFYVLHHPVVVVIAAVVVAAPLAMWLKFTVIAVVSLAVTAAIYEGLVRRFSPLRAIFGVGVPEARGPGSSAVGDEIETPVAT
jgi:fucose 4-O-acetylase-like acetyltransferase